MTRVTDIITQQLNETNGLRMVLRPSTLNVRRNFRNRLENQINNSETNRLPYLNIIENDQLIDSETIIEINNSTTSERRIELMRSIVDNENINNNTYYFLTNSTNQVRTYLHDLLIRSASNMNIREEDLYRVGNIFLYTIANLNEEGLLIRDIIQHLRENLVIYNTDQIIRVLENHIPVYNDYLESIRLSTEEQLEERTQEFHQQVEERIILNRQRILYAGMGLVGSMALTSMGFPPVGGVIARTIANVSTNSASSSEIIRLRDVWDASLKKLLDIIEK